MMQKDKARQIKNKLMAARSKLMAAVEGLDEAQWNWRPGDGRWSVRLTLAHVGASHWSHLEVARSLVAGETVHLPGFDLDAWNEVHVAERADWSVDQVLVDLEAAQRATFAFLDGLDAEELAVTGSHPALGEMSVGQLVRVTAFTTTCTGAMCWGFGARWAAEARHQHPATE